MSTDEVQGLSTKTSMLLGSMALRDLRLEASLESSCEALSDSKLDQLGVDHWVEASTVRTIIQSITTDTFGLIGIVFVYLFLLKHFF